MKLLIRPLKWKIFRSKGGHGGQGGHRFSKLLKKKEINQILFLHFGFGSFFPIILEKGQNDVRLVRLLFSTFF
jgi:hypothetical protein